MIDRAKAEELADVIKAHLAKLSIPGVTIKLGHYNYSKENIVAKVEIAEVVDGVAQTREAESFKWYCSRWGMQPTDLGREFTYKRKRYKIIGATPRSRRCPILAENIRTGTSMRFSSVLVKKTLQ